MYTLVLVIHSWIRWVALATGIGATVLAMRGSGPSGDSKLERFGMAFVSLLDLQLLLGLLLYLVLSPNMVEIRANFGAAMKDPVARFWAVEHLTAMLAAVILAHVGRLLARKAKTPDALRSRLLVCFGLATVLMIVGMPWPGRPGGRPLLRV